MDELVQTVVKETGLPEAQVRQVTESVIKHMKEKLPAALASQVETALNNPDMVGSAQGLLSQGKSLFNK